MTRVIQSQWACAIGVSVLILIASATHASAQCRLGWLFGDQQSLPGVSRASDVAITFDDGSGEALYVGGRSIDKAGNVRATGIARWDGLAWSAVGDLVLADVFALTVYKGRLIAGGWFELPGGEQAQVIRWDGQAWASMSEGLTAVVGTFVTFRGRLVLSHTNNGSSHQHPSPRPAHWNYSWNGERWVQMGSGNSSAASSFAVYKGELYARMRLWWIQPNSPVSKWNGTEWEPFEQITFASKLLVHDGKLLVSGVHKVNGIRFNDIAAWDGKDWTDFGKSLPGDVFAMFEHEGTVYATGRDKPRLPTHDLSYVAVWNGDEWQQIGASSLYGLGRGIEMFDGELIAVGLSAPHRGAKGIARWDGLDWKPLGVGFDDKITRFAVHGGELFATGDFGQAGTTGGVDGFARWDGTEWRAAGAGRPNREILEFVTFGDDLIAVGEFTEIGGIEANYIARWDGVEWSAVGDGADAPILGAVVFEGELVVGGKFTSIGGVAAEKMASWDGFRWRQFGSGFDDDVLAVHVNDGILYATGNFERSLGGKNLNHIAKWNGREWEMVASGLPGLPVGLGSYRDQLMVLRWIRRGPGYGRSEMTVVSWDGSEFREIGAVGSSSRILDMVEFNDELYITGDFNLAGGGPALRIARWNGREWRQLDGGVGRAFSGTHPQSHALAVYNGELFVGGAFLEVDGKVSAHLARWGCVSCYADCDDSTGAGVLDLFDFVCFQSSFIAGDSYACDCDTSTGSGVCDMFDFLCFVDQFTAGCK